MPQIHEINHKEFNEHDITTKDEEAGITDWQQHKGPSGVGHTVKYIRTFGNYISPNAGSSYLKGPIGLWLEWEAPTEYRLNRFKAPNYPNAIHRPFCNGLPYGENPHSTDPYLLSENREIGHFFYTDCKQNNKMFTKGDLIISTYGNNPNKKILVCVLVVGESVQFKLAEYLTVLNDYPHPAIPEHYIKTTLEPLARCDKKNEKRYLCRGVHFSERHLSDNGLYSYFPASTSLHGRPPCEISLDINKKLPFEVWLDLKKQVLEQGFSLGLDIKF